jgi:hypothetical protein
MSAKLYEPCTACDANGKLHGVNQFGIFIEVDCSCRGTKFQEIGLTVNQLERLTRKAEALNRIAQMVKSLDVIELGTAAERLDDATDSSDLEPSESYAASARMVFAARDAIVAIRNVIKGVTGPLRSKSG